MSLQLTDSQERNFRPEKYRPCRVQDSTEPSKRGQKSAYSVICDNDSDIRSDERPFHSGSLVVPSNW